MSKTVSSIFPKRFPALAAPTLLMIAAYHVLAVSFMKSEDFSTIADTLQGIYWGQLISAGVIGAAIFLTLMVGVLVSPKDRHLRRENLSGSAAAILATWSGLAFSSAIVFHDQIEEGPSVIPALIIGALACCGALIFAVISVHDKRKRQSDKNSKAQMMAMVVEIIQMILAGLAGLLVAFTLR